jgi:hypothetical protein
VRTPAHVEPLITRPIDRQLLALGKLGRPFGLECLALSLPAGNQLLALPHLTAQRLVCRDDLAHLRLDPGQVLLGKGPVLRREVIIETIIGRWSKGDLRPRKQRLHRFGQHMGKIMPRQFQRVRLVP